ncbi:MAG: metallophosphoesterase [Candidatus Nanoarchaeia archaeon]|nr:metallophosphoesterase [Candidatus Nanoarchaeia archaeon]
MKYLIVGDLHGNKPNIYFDGFDAIIAPGDFCSDATRKDMFEALRQNLQNPGSKVNWYDFVGKTKARQMVLKSIADGRKILEFLNSFDVPVYMVPGNWEWIGEKDSDWDFLRKDRYTPMIEGLENVVDVHHRIVDAGEHQIIGHGITSGPEFPQHKEELERLKKDPKKFKQKKADYERQMKKVDSLFRRARKPVIFMPHNVPFNTPIDKITNKDSPR